MQHLEAAGSRVVEEEMPVRECQVVVGTPREIEREGTGVATDDDAEVGVLPAGSGTDSSASAGGGGGGQVEWTARRRLEFESNDSLHHQHNTNGVHTLLPSSSSSSSSAAPAVNTEGSQQQQQRSFASVVGGRSLGTAGGSSCRSELGREAQALQQLLGDRREQRQQLKQTAASLWVDMRKQYDDDFLPSSPTGSTPWDALLLPQTLMTSSSLGLDTQQQQIDYSKKEGPPAPSPPQGLQMSSGSTGKCSSGVNSYCQRAVLLEDYLRTCLAIVKEERQLSESCTVARSLEEGTESFQENTLRPLEIRQNGLERELAQHANEEQKRKNFFDGSLVMKNLQEGSSSSSSSCCAAETAEAYHRCLAHSYQNALQEELVVPWKAALDQLNSLDVQVAQRMEELSRIQDESSVVSHRFAPAQILRIVTEEESERFGLLCDQSEYLLGLLEEWAVVGNGVLQQSSSSSSLRPAGVDDQRLAQLREELEQRTVDLQRLRTLAGDKEAQLSVLQSQIDSVEDLPHQHRNQHQPHQYDTPTVLDSLFGVPDVLVKEGAGDGAGAGAGGGEGGEVMTRTTTNIPPPTKTSTIKEPVTNAATTSDECSSNKNADSADGNADGAALPFCSFDPQKAIDDKLESLKQQIDSLSIELDSRPVRGPSSTTDVEDEGVKNWNHLSHSASRLSTELSVSSIASPGRSPRPQGGGGDGGGREPMRDDHESVNLFRTIDTLEAQVLHLSAELASVQSEQQQYEAYKDLLWYQQLQRDCDLLYSEGIEPLQAEVKELKEAKQSGHSATAASRHLEREELMKKAEEKRATIEEKRKKKYALEDEIARLEALNHQHERRKEQYVAAKRYFHAQSSRPGFYRVSAGSTSSGYDGADDEEVNDFDATFDVVEGSPIRKQQRSAASPFTARYDDGSPGSRAGVEKNSQRTPSSSSSWGISGLVGRGKGLVQWMATTGTGLLRGSHHQHQQQKSDNKSSGSSRSGGRGGGRVDDASAAV